jgi:hypothetical protein
MRASHVRLRLWHLMAVVAIAGIVSDAYVYIFPLEPPGPSTEVIVFHSFTASVEVAGHVFPHTSPAFWIILILTLAALLALFVGTIAAIVWTVKAWKRRGISNS